MLQCLRGFGFCFPTVFSNEKLGFGDGNGILKRVFGNAFSENEGPEIFKEKHRAEPVGKTEGEGGTSVV